MSSVQKWSPPPNILSYSTFKSLPKSEGVLSTFPWPRLLNSFIPQKGKVSLTNLKKVRNGKQTQRKCERNLINFNHVTGNFLRKSLSKVSCSSIFFSIFYLFDLYKIQSLNTKVQKNVIFRENWKS